jgi:hypothetical protein
VTSRPAPAPAGDTVLSRAQPQQRPATAGPRDQPDLPAVADGRPTATSGTPPDDAADSAAARIYTADDPGVTPPTMLRPMLPADPPLTVPADAVGTLDLVIDEEGNVEQVKLSSPANRYQERMLVASAKSWKFKPAMRNGRPVKYRARLRVTI